MLTMASIVPIKIPPIQKEVDVRIILFHSPDKSAGKNLQIISKSNSVK
tara:strand:- start:275 stop:418 length:144 start_codon:yes stop_codon:yes gene_type:complete